LKQRTNTRYFTVQLSTALAHACSHVSRVILWLNLPLKARHIWPSISAIVKTYVHKVDFFICLWYFWTKCITKVSSWVWSHLWLPKTLSASYSRKYVSILALQILITCNLHNHKLPAVVHYFYERSEGPAAGTYEHSTEPSHYIKGR